MKKGFLPYSIHLIIYSSKSIGHIDPFTPAFTLTQLSVPIPETITPLATL